MQKNKVKKIVKKFYGKIAAGESCGCSCGSGGKKENEQIAKSIGYSAREIKAVPGANLGLGCGNPVAMGKIKEGDTVLDLGSGAGLDSFLASRRVGSSGRVIGVDMTREMIEKARANAEKYGYKNVEFKLGDIEKLPIEDDSIDVIVSNCVINLAPNKAKVFTEGYRVLRAGGRMYVSDIVLLKKLSPAQRADENLVAGCVGGALLKNDYLKIIRNAGFRVKILSEDKEISKRQYEGAVLESLKVEAVK